MSEADNRPANRAGVLAVAAILLCPVLFGSAGCLTREESARSQASVATLGRLFGVAESAGVYSAEDAAAGRAALDQLGVAVSTSRAAETVGAVVEFVRPFVGPVIDAVVDAAIRWFFEEPVPVPEPVPEPVE